MRGDYSRRQGTKRLNTLDLVALAWGGMIGTGIFLAVGIPLRLAGVLSVLVYLCGGLLITAVAAMLAEMTAYQPHDGGYSFYVQEYLGRFWGFLVGWNYWVASVFTLLTEVTAAALLTRWWLPSFPLWLLVSLYSVLVVAVTLMGLRSLSFWENLMAFAKAAGLAAFALWGLVTLAHGFPGAWPVTRQAVLPEGWRGLLASFPVVLYCYAALSIVSLAAPQTARPCLDVPRAVLLAGLGCTLLYLLCVVALIGLFPCGEVPINASPMTVALATHGCTWASDAINGLILIAVLSVMLASLYGASSMLASLARRGEAPSFLAEYNWRGIPYRAVWVTAALLAAGITLAYFLPHQVFRLVVASASFLIFLNWIPTVVAYMVFRRRVLASRLPFRVPAYPLLPLLALSLLLAVLLAVPQVPSQLPSFYIGLSFTVLWSVLYFSFTKR
ncbi:amino acid permease [Desulfothermobacter acidiphilus]|uniref:amino acid permease n=1 Tax=Desulfothermobacter acidiphilus TaxID=1938353 RepID=UPI003F8C5912